MTKIRFHNIVENLWSITLFYWHTGGGISYRMIVPIKLKWGTWLFHTGTVHWLSKECTFKGISLGHFQDKICWKYLHELVTATWFEYPVEKLIILCNIQYIPSQDKLAIKRLKITTIKVKLAWFLILVYCDHK